jgi:hypothetical protein
MIWMRISDAHLISLIPVEDMGNQASNMTQRSRSQKREWLIISPCRSPVNDLLFVTDAVVPESHLLGQTVLEMWSRTRSRFLVIQQI